ncbi:hypothetical protein B0H14DRAFT_243620 [Mycena olivaceomarginata]|nr:hypothetical protein B0H14DRAFT_243620 [Mycena olivaceomarginata]
MPAARASRAHCASCPRTGNAQCLSRLCKTCCCAQSAVCCYIHERPHPPTLATTSRQLPATHLEEATPRRRRESIAFPAPRPRKRELPHEHLASQQESRCADAAAPIANTLARSMRRDACHLSRPWDLAPPPSVTTADTRCGIFHLACRPRPAPPAAHTTSTTPPSTAPPTSASPAVHTTSTALPSTAPPTSAPPAVHTTSMIPPSTAPPTGRPHARRAATQP